MKIQNNESRITPFSLPGANARVVQREEGDTHLLDELEAIVVEAQLRQEEEMSL